MINLDLQTVLQKSTSNFPFINSQQKFTNIYHYFNFQLIKTDCVISWSDILWLVEVVVNGQNIVALAFVLQQSWKPFGYWRRQMALSSLDKPERTKTDGANSQSKS